MSIYRQGDILIASVASIPPGLTQVPLENGRVVIAHGEVTGHAHAITNPDTATFLAADVNDLEQRFLRVEREALLEHDEHATIILPPGEYRVTRQREYAGPEPMYVAD